MKRLKLLANLVSVDIGTLYEVLSFVFGEREFMTSTEIAEKVGKSRAYVLRGVSRLKEAGLVGSKGGVHCPHKKYYLKNPHDKFFEDSSFEVKVNFRLRRKAYDKLVEAAGGTGNVSQKLRELVDGFLQGEDSE